jgi:hypothetical protein
MYGCIGLHSQPNGSKLYSSIWRKDEDTPDERVETFGRGCNSTGLFAFMMKTDEDWTSLMKTVLEGRNVLSWMQFDWVFLYSFTLTRVASENMIDIMTRLSQLTNDLYRFDCMFLHPCAATVNTFALTYFVIVIRGDFSKLPIEPLVRLYFASNTVFMQTKLNGTGYYGLIFRSDFTS